MINYKSYIGPRSQKNTKHTLQHIVVRRREDDDAYRIKDKMDPENMQRSFPASYHGLDQSYTRSQLMLRVVHQKLLSLNIGWFGTRL